MSHLLWKYYLEDDVDKFRRLLANATHSSQHASKAHCGGPAFSNSFGNKIGSSGGFGTSPKTFTKNRKVPGSVGNIGGNKGHGNALSRAELNSRDYAGLTLLHRAASSTSATAIIFATALIEHPSIDLYIQDTESGWTALHRALYFGNVTIARAIIERDSKDRAAGNTGGRSDSSVTKVKDREGNTPFDVYNATIARRSLQEEKVEEPAHLPDDEDDNGLTSLPSAESLKFKSIDGDEIYAFGSNKNFSLGFGDQDDRQYPEKIILKRPDHLLFRFYQEYLDTVDEHTPIGSPKMPKTISELPSMIQNKPIVVQDVTLSKLSSAILTTDPESNLYMCGFGPGGRLGTGDETTRFNYVPVDQGGLAGKKVGTVALGQNHTLAVSSEGEVFSWGTNTWGQLGYNLPRPSLKDEEPFCTTPRQIFGPLKRETILGIAASAIHSVAHTSTSLFCWGKNEGQLGLMDSDSRSLESQLIPRRVAASLFKSSIVKVSAINGATTCLLKNHAVCVFTNYGYTMVKFPLYEGFTNYHLQSSSVTTRYDSGSNHITSIESGGDTIAAISGRGDLFTLNVRKYDMKVSAASTTNPTKIKEALSPPQRIWSLRKGNWDGIKSVGVAENGTVIVCTQAGAVWRSIKRAKNKDTFTGNNDYNRKDFKFQRVPGLTQVAAVRSNPFGVFAAIRKDCDVTRTQVAVEGKNLWKDIEPLLSIRDLVASEDPVKLTAEVMRFASAKGYDSVRAAVIKSSDLEADVDRLLMGQGSESGGYNVDLCSSTSDTKIPIHGFMLAGRSSVLRSLLNDFRHSGTASLPDILDIEKGNDGKTRIIFKGLDFITLVNFVIYLYTDRVVDVWNFTKFFPSMAFRLRQVRTELMRLSSQLRMPWLEAPVRVMVQPSDKLNCDMDIAITDETFFDDCDAIVELDADEMPIHSVLVCRRCPFFDCLFNGRSGGRWLASRRAESTDPVRIDLKHIASETFELVRRYLYADVGPELFDNIVSADIDEFSEIVMDVMSVANELMIDRLSQICQLVLGRFVNTRNVCNIVNAVAPCSITELKDAGFEYMCLQLESILGNHLIDDLDEDLVLELDEVARDNQLNCLPFTKSGRADLDLHEKYPELAGDIDEERRRRLGDMTFRAHLRDDDNRISSSFKARIGSLDDNIPSPSCDKARRKSRVAKNEPFSPTIRPKESVADLMFDMDDDEGPGSPSDLNLAIDLTSASPCGPTTPRFHTGISTPKVVNSGSPTYLPNSVGLGVQYNQGTPQPGTKTWSSPNLSLKLDMKEIMAQASTSRTSNLSMSLSAQKAKDEANAKSSTPKLSQKERKKQQAAFQQAIAQTPVDKGKDKAPSPWQIAGVGSKANLEDIFDKENKFSPSPLPSKSTNSPASTPPITRRIASTDTRFSGQRRNDNSSIMKAQRSSPAPSRPNMPAPSKSTPLTPHSKSYTAPAAKAEPSLQLSMADIIGMQQREQEVIKEAVAKRSLQEIQEEQAFQEWWDKESKRAQEEEASRAKASTSISSGRGGGRSGGGRGKGVSRGRGGRGRGGGDSFGRGGGGNTGGERGKGKALEENTFAN